MPTYVITCPACKQRFKASKMPPIDKPFVCPKCGYTAQINKSSLNDSAQPVTLSGDDLQQPAAPVTASDPVPEAAPAVAPAPAAAPTKKVAGTKVKTGMALEVKAYMTVAGNGTKFVLIPGIYIMGRRSSDSNASLQIAPDIRMSREHARLAVQKVGGQVMARIIGLKADNPVLINNKILPAGQPYTLKNGDCVQLGATRIIYSV